MTSSHITFLVDNQILAQAVASKNLCHNPGPWEIRHQLAATSHIQIQVHHIPRNLNSRAHNCAAKANLIDSLHSPKITCCKLTHVADHYPTLMKLGNLHLKDCKITDVLCT